MTYRAPLLLLVMTFTFHIQLVSAATPAGGLKALAALSLFDQNGEEIGVIRTGDDVELLPRGGSADIAGHLRVKLRNGKVGYVASPHLLLSLAPANEFATSSTPPPKVAPVPSLLSTFKDLSKGKECAPPSKVNDLDAGCSMQLKSLRNNDLRWDYRRSAQMIAHCEPPPVKVIQRKYVGGPSGKACKNATLPRADANSGVWNSCPLVHECSPSELEELHKSLERSRKIQTGKCEDSQPALGNSIETAGNKTGKASRQHTTKQSKSKKQVQIRRVASVKQTSTDCLEPFEPGTVHRSIAIHHTVYPAERGSPAVIRDMHVLKSKNPFVEMGYHFLLAPDVNGEWQVYEGRPLKYKSAHGGPGLSDDSISIVIGGNYDPETAGPDRPMTPELQPPPAAVLKLMGLVKKLKDEHPHMAQIQGHDEYRHSHRYCATKCPGPGCQHLVQQIRGRFFAKTGGAK